MNCILKQILFISFLFLGYNIFAFTKKPLADSNIIVVDKIIIIGNKTTKEKIIRRELFFTEGDTINKKELVNVLLKTKENLFNTSLFNFITINTIDNNPNHSSIFIILEERWYLWPYPILEHADRNLSAFLHENDWSRINYGLMVTKFNFRGRKETIKVKARFGYKEQYQFYYSNPYLSKNKKHGLAIEFSWYRQHESSYITLNDKLEFYRDSNNYAKKYHTTYLTYQYRNVHYTTHHLTFGYTYINVLDTIAKLNHNYIGNGKSNTEFLSIRYNYNHDKRDYRHYPLTGFNISGYIEQKGLSLIKEEMGGVTSVGLSGYKYFNHTGRWYSGIGGSLKLSSNKDQPFFLQNALGYDNYLRAYEYNVIDGQNIFTSRTFVKYAIIPLNVQQINSWGWKKFNKIHYSFYVNLFFDSGYVKNNYSYSDISNTLPNTYLYGGGIGIDLVAYYDQIIRFEYSINKNKESGFFLHIGKAF